VLSGFFDLATWADGVDHSSALTATPVGLGATRRVQVKSSVLIEEIVHFEPESVLAYQIRGLPPVAFQVENRWQLTRRANGGTDISLTLTMEPLPKPIAKLIAQLLRRRMASANRKFVKDLITASQHAKAPHLADNDGASQ
jgi:hypothetical protein